MGSFTAKRVSLIAALVFITASVPAVASAKCDSTSPSSYDDIEAVMLAQNGCGGTVGSLSAPAPAWRLKTRFECSAYWVLFRESGGNRFPTEYSQFNLKQSVGTYHVSATLDDAREILRRHNFFSLSPPGGYIADAAQAVLSVRRCAVITRIVIFTGSGNSEASTAALFADLATLVETSSKVSISSAPKVFAESGIFDPLSL
jgi:hypothetical protein